MIAWKIVTYLAAWFFLLQSLFAAWGILCALNGYRFQDATRDFLWVPILILLAGLTALSVVITAVELERSSGT
jgi:hypothetical protein